jgi:hypothetical protein
MPTGGKLILAVGNNNRIKSSSANVFGYLAKDNIIELEE